MSLTDKAALDGEPELFIHIVPDKTNKTITIHDSGTPQFQPDYPKTYPTCRYLILCLHVMARSFVYMPERPASNLRGSRRLLEPDPSPAPSAALQYLLSDNPSNLHRNHRI